LVDGLQGRDRLTKAALAGLALFIGGFFVYLVAPDAGIALSSAGLTLMLLAASVTAWRTGRRRIGVVGAAILTFTPAMLALVFGWASISSAGVAIGAFPGPTQVPSTPRPSATPVVQEQVPAVGTPNRP
jgi:hypothetical protein